MKTSFKTSWAARVRRYVTGGSLARDIALLFLVVLPIAFLGHLRHGDAVGWAPYTVFVVPVAVIFLIERFERKGYRLGRFHARLLAESGFEAAPVWFRDGEEVGGEGQARACASCGATGVAHALWSRGGTPPETLVTAWLCSECAITELRLRDSGRVESVQRFIKEMEVTEKAR